VIYGVNPVLEALKAHPASIERIILSTGRAGAPADSIIKAAKVHEIRIDRADPKELEKLTGSAKHQGAAALLSGEFPYADLDDLIQAWKKSKRPAFFLILDSIQDPQNLGSLVRTAGAAGAHGVIIPKDRASDITPTVVKASAGATAHVAVARVTNLVNAISQLKEEGVWVAAVEADANQSIYNTDFNSDTALVIGSEGAGIRRLIKKTCDFSVSIPMSGKVNSLNAAQAGAITMFEILRQRTA
jgi:23S rRNA (guanosine2251-2'-O)-methyltransferase